MCNGKKTRLLFLIWHIFYYFFRCSGTFAIKSLGICTVDTVFNTVFVVVSHVFQNLQGNVLILAYHVFKSSSYNDGSYFQVEKHVLV